VTRPPVPLVVTGLGVVCAEGAGREAAAAALARGEAPLAEVDRSGGYHLADGARFAALAAHHGTARWVPPMAARRMCPSSRMAVAAARMAVEEAGLEPGSPELDGAAVVVATAYGSAQVTEQLLHQILLESPETVSPALFTESVANAPAAQVALVCRARGANITVTQRQAGPPIALGLAMTELAAGRCRRVIVGAVDEVNPLLHAVLDRFRALARSTGDAPELARPFDRRRDGFVAGEGATLLVLEGADEAHARGAKALARLELTASAFDPSAPRAGWGRDPVSLAGALRRRLERAGIALDSFGAVVTGTCGSPSGDRLEALLLRSLWGEARLPPLLAPKAVLGENGAALLAAAVLAVEGAAFGSPVGFAQPDPELGVEPHGGGPTSSAPRVLVSSPAVGGAASWAVLGRP